MKLSQPQFDDMAFDDASNQPAVKIISVPTKARNKNNTHDQIHVPFDSGATAFQLNMDVTKPDNFTIMITLQDGEHTPIVELQSVDGKLTQPVMEVNDYKLPGEALNNEATKFAFPDGSQLEQFSTSDADGKFTQVILAHKGNNYTITSRAEGSNYMAKVARQTKDGAKESIRFVAADERPFVTYSKPTV